MSNLCIIKTHRNKKFATINLTAEEDKNLSWKAKGIHTYLISRPDNWEVYLAELEKRSTDGRDGLRAGLVELNKAGYLDWHQKNENGKFSKTQYDIYEVPNAAVIKKATGKLPQNQKKDEPHTENPEAVPHTALPDTEKAEAVLHKKSKKSMSNKEKTNSEPHTALPDSGKSAPTIYHSSNNTNNQYNPAPQIGADKSVDLKTAKDSFVVLLDFWYSEKGEPNPGTVPPRFDRKKYTELVAERITEGRTWRQLSAAVRNYWRVVKSPAHYYKHQGSISWFIAKGIDQFWSELNPWENFKDRNKDKNGSTKTGGVVLGFTPEAYERYRPEAQIGMQ